MNPLVHGGNRGTRPWQIREMQPRRNGLYGPYSNTFGKSLPRCIALDLFHYGCAAAIRFIGSKR